MKDARSSPQQAVKVCWSRNHFLLWSKPI